MTILNLIGSKNMWGIEPQLICKLPVRINSSDHLDVLLKKFRITPRGNTTFPDFAKLKRELKN